MPAQIPWWTWACPLFAWVILLITAFAGTGGGFLQASAGIILIPTVFSAVHHAEVVAHRTGEPFGTLVLAVAVTVIEVALIVGDDCSAVRESGARTRYGVRGGYDRVQWHRRPVPALGAAHATTSKAFRFMEQALHWRYWQRSRSSPWFCPI